MRHEHTSRRKIRLPGWRLCLCVLLVGLIVYNPFLALHGTAGSSCYEKLASNRATIGSSELQHFTPVSNPDELAEVSVEVIATEPAVQVRAHQPGLIQPEVAPAQPERFASLWFRPPPTL